MRRLPTAAGALGRVGRARDLARPGPRRRWRSSPSPSSGAAGRCSASLPLALCNLALLVAAVACWEPSWHLAVELTYFWGLAGTLQAVVTPDLDAGFPQLEFFEFVVGHLGVVIAALYLVVGLRLRPRPGAVKRVFAVTVVYTAFVGWFDWLTGSNYMFLAAIPATGSLLVGPRPVALVHPQRGRRRTRPVLGPRCAVPPPHALRWAPAGGSPTGPVTRSDRSRDADRGTDGGKGTDNHA